MKNFVQEGEQLAVVVTSPATPASGNAVRYGQLTGVAILDEGAGGVGATQTMVKFDGGVYSLSVTDTVGGGITVGSALYLHDGSPPTIDNLPAGGYFFGFALTAVSSTATATINVLHRPTGAPAPAVYPLVSPSATVAAKTADGNLAAGDFGKNITNTGASGTITLTLPAAGTANVKGAAMRVYVTAAQVVRLLPQTGEKIYLAGSGVATKYLNIAGTIGNYVDVYCDGTDYHVVGFSGVVTKEA